MTISKDRLQQLLAKLKQPAPEQQPTVQTSSTTSQFLSVGKHGESISLNAEQASFVTMASRGESCVLIGAAGTGKTTCMRATIESLCTSTRIPIITDGNHKYLPNAGVPGIVACSFTRRSVNNLRKAMPHGLERNCITIHKLLEFKPTKEVVTDPETQEEKIRKVFKPSRHQYNPLPSAIKVIIIDEASTVSVELFQMLTDALEHEVQFILLGDIQQLPPVMGSAILGFKMLEYPTTELTQVYRQALESPIIKYATQIRNGLTFAVPSTIVEDSPKGKVTFHPWKKSIDSEEAKATFIHRFILPALDAGEYDPLTDAILIPFNKAFGTIDINAHIANHIAKKEERIVWEVIAGFNKLYFSVGDHVLYDREDATIIAIERNPSYLGKRPQRESQDLDYFGYSKTPQTQEELTEDEIHAQLDKLVLEEDPEDRVQAASHILTVRLDESDMEVQISSASELNSLLLSYALTVHKSQGSEWDKVFLILHQSHNTMIQRELLYTGVTRAAKELYCICEKDTFVKGVKSQKVKGTTLAEKAEFFKGKLNEGKIPLFNKK